MINSMHMVHALNLGIELELFRTLSHCTPPVTVEKFIESVPYATEFIPTWIHVMQSAGVIEVDQEQVITFKDDWQEALTDGNSTIYASGLPKCHLEIAKSYQKFPEIYKGRDELTSVHNDMELISAIAADGRRFLNIFDHQVIDKIPHLRFKLNDGCTLYEVGCGGGDFLIHLAERFPSSQFTGIDLSENAIHLAKIRNDQIGPLNNVTFFNTCVTKLDASIADCIAMIEVLHEIRVEIRIEALKACWRALKPDGIFFIIDILAPEDPVAYNKGQRILSSLIQFFEAPWGSELVSRNRFYGLLKDAGIDNARTIFETDEIIAVYAKKE
ncbi:MAG: class I SAM-dependent methyltransferase [Desulfobacteraceae bacterium]|jgi:ubiquinone/menaquinone biosynthesis C-methylase UbiE